MIVIIDNYDSFSYNLVQMFGTICEHSNSQEVIKVIRNDELSVNEVISLQPSHIILSPGPGYPRNAGICEELIKAIVANHHQIKLLGVCLGHQAICEVFGATITYANQLMHGKQSVIRVDTNSSLFQGLEETISVARYHSLAADQGSIPASLKVIASAEDGEVMAVKHNNHEIYGVQFHPESVLTPNGATILENFLKVKI